MKLFAGPCSLESADTCFKVAETIRDTLPSEVDYFFKTSFAKGGVEWGKSFSKTIFLASSTRSLR